jgi:hypothetical protein
MKQLRSADVPPASRPPAIVLASVEFFAVNPQPAHAAMRES